jgi:hypothetical protein
MFSSSFVKKFLYAFYNAIGFYSYPPKFDIVRIFILKAENIILIVHKYSVSTS